MLKSPPCRDLQKRNPARHPALREGILEALEGYDARSRIEAKMRCIKAFGDFTATRDPDRQTAETQIRIALINSFTELGTAEIVRVA